ncbi:MAG: aldehyde dehydrogenase family protein, partial [Nannocystaceae bacterium]
MTAPHSMIQPINPATGAAMEPVACTSEAEISEIVGRAHKAQSAWAAKSVEQRGKHLEAFVAQLESSGESLAQLISGEMGKPIREARGEIRNLGPRVAAYIKRATEACAAENNQDGRVRVSVRWRPLGVVAVIGPWNYPVATPANLLFSALITGNAVVFKPSEYTPKTGALLHKLLADALPEGVLGLVQGAGAQGAALVASDVDMVAFTGSIATGQAIMRTAAASMKRLVLELGGKDPMIVLPGADMEAAATHAARESVRNAGQVCVAVERLLVHRDIAPAFTQRVAEIVRGLTVGDPGDEATDMGPMVSARQREQVLAQIADARSRGATVVVDGQATGPGSYLHPSVLAGITEDMDIARHETFGPVVAIQEVDSGEHALELANASIYGLGASIWGAPGPELDALADR